MDISISISQSDGGVPGDGDPDDQHGVPDHGAAPAAGPTHLPHRPLQTPAPHAATHRDRHGETAHKLDLRLPLWVSVSPESPIIH